MEEITGHLIKSIHVELDKSLDTVDIVQGNDSVTIDMTQAKELIKFLKKAIKETKESS